MQRLPLQLTQLPQPGQSHFERRKAYLLRVETRIEEDPQHGNKTNDNYNNSCCVLASQGWMTSKENEVCNTQSSLILKKRPWKDRIISHVCKNDEAKIYNADNK